MPTVTAFKLKKTKNMAIVRYSSVRCDVCLGCDPAKGFDNAKEALKYFKSVGFIRAHGKDFCSNECLVDYTKSLVSDNP